MCCFVILLLFFIYEAFFCNPAPQWELMEFRARIKKYLHLLSQLDCTSNFDCTFCRLYKFIELLPQFSTLTLTHKMHRVKQISTQTKLPDTMHEDFPPSFPVCRRGDVHRVPFLFINYRIYMALDETTKTILIYV